MSGNRRMAELGSFLRQRRRALRPGDVGITSLGRRHVKGLRREEVAQLSGIGVSWYTLLEQGRVTTLTRRTLEGIADALRLNTVEREHVFRVAGSSVVPTDPADLAAPASVLRFVNSIVEAPAFIMTGRFDVLAWNATAGSLFYFDDMPEGANLLREMAVDERMHVVFPTWRDTIRNMIGVFRANYGRVGDETYDALIAELRAGSNEFAQAWDEQQVVLLPENRCVVNHPEHGLVDMHLHAFVPIESPLHLLVSFTYEGEKN